MTATGLSLKHNNVVNNSGRKLGRISRTSFKEVAPLSCQDASNMIPHFVSPHLLWLTHGVACRTFCPVSRLDRRPQRAPLHVVPHVGVTYVTQLRFFQLCFQQNEPVLRVLPVGWKSSVLLLMQEDCSPTALCSESLGEHMNPRYCTLSWWAVKTIVSKSPNPLISVSGSGPGLPR